MVESRRRSAEPGSEERWNVSGRRLARARWRCGTTGRESVCLFGARYPHRAVGVAIVMLAVNGEAMSEHLKEISTQVTPGGMLYFSAMELGGARAATSGRFPRASGYCRY